MRCDQLPDILDDYLDGTSDQVTAAAVLQHVESCTSCNNAVNRERSLRAALAGLPIEGPNEDFFKQAIDRATKRSTRRTDTLTKAWPLRFGGAVAAVFAFLFMAALLIQQPYATSSSEFPGVTLGLDEVKSVALVFTSENTLRGARISLQLPKGIELLGYSGRTELSWTTDLERGKNVLRLPLVGHDLLDETIIARLEHPSGTKTFQLKVTVI